MPSSFNIHFHEVLKKEIGDSEEDGLLRQKEIQLGLGQFKDLPEAMKMVGYCEAVREVLGRAEEIRKRFMEG